MGDNKSEVRRRFQHLEIIYLTDEIDPALRVDQESYYSRLSSILARYRELYSISDDATKFALLAVLRDITSRDIHTRMEFSTNPDLFHRTTWLNLHNALFEMFRNDGLLDDGGIPEMSPATGPVQATGPILGNVFDSIPGPPPDPSAPLPTYEVVRAIIHHPECMDPPEPITHLPLPFAYVPGREPPGYMQSLRSRSPIREAIGRRERSYSPVGEAAGRRERSTSPSEDRP
jgi:hypothetical protein